MNDVLLLEISDVNDRWNGMALMESRKERGLEPDTENAATSGQTETETVPSAPVKVLPTQK